MAETKLINRLKASGLQHSVAETLAEAIQAGPTQAKISIMKWLSIFGVAIVALVLSLCLFMFFFFRYEMTRVDDTLKSELGIVGTKVDNVEDDVTTKTINVHILESKLETTEFDVRVLQSAVQDLNDQTIEFKYMLECARHPIGRCPARLDDD